MNGERKTNNYQVRKKEVIGLIKRGKVGKITVSTFSMSGASV